MEQGTFEDTSSVDNIFFDIDDADAELSYID